MEVLATSHLGFSGTRNKLLTPQANILFWWLETYRTVGIKWFHHGDCIGGDNEAATKWTELGGSTCAHPPSDPKLRAYHPSTMSLYPRGYIERNHSIVDAASIMIFCPRTMVEELRSGTWATWRYAKEKYPEKLRTMIFPNGTVSLT